MDARKDSHERWVLDDNADDLRGWVVLDRKGHRYGTVRRMFVDPMTEHLAALEVDDGKRFSAHDLLIGDHMLVLDLPMEAPAPPEQPVVLAQPPPAPPLRVVPLSPDVPMPVPPTPPPVRKSAVQAARDERDDLLMQLLDPEVALGRRHVEAHLVPELQPDDATHGRK